MSKIILTLAVFCASLTAGSLVSSAPQLEPKDVIVLTKLNHVVINQEVSQQSVKAAMDKFATLFEKRRGQKYTIYLVLDTPGGSVDAGYRLYEFLRTYENVSTITITSMSMGAILVELLPGERLMLETGVLMFHRMRLRLGMSTTDEVESQIAFLKRMEEFAEDRISKRSGVPRDVLRAKLNQEWHLVSKDAIENNLIDRTVVVRCDSKVMKSTTTKEVSIAPFLPTIEIQVSDCPIRL